MGYKIKTVELEKAVKELSQLSDFEYGVIQKAYKGYKLTDKYGGQSFTTGWKTKSAIYDIVDFAIGTLKKQSKTGG